jgi:tetratricopeptide (TPR) repeat protein
MSLKSLSAVNTSAPFIQRSSSLSSLGSTEVSSFYVASSIVEKAIQNYDAGDHEQSLKLLATALKTQRLTLGDNDLCVAHTLGNIGSVYITLGWYDDAMQVLQECLKIKMRLRADPTLKLPKGCEYIDLYDTLSNLGSASFLKGDYYNAMSYFQECLREITSGPIPGDASDIANVLYNIGNVHCVLNEFEDALLAMNESLQLIQSSFGLEDIRCAEALEKIGAIQLHQKNVDDALASLVESLRITKTTLGSEHVDCAVSLYHVGLVYEGKGEMTRAMESYRAALEIFRQKGVENHSVDKIRQRLIKSG